MIDMANKSFTEEAAPDFLEPLRPDDASRDPREARLDRLSDEVDRLQWRVETIDHAKLKRAARLYGWILTTDPWNQIPILHTLADVEAATQAALKRWREIQKLNRGREPVQSTRLRVELWAREENAWFKYRALRIQRDRLRNPSQVSNESAVTQVKRERKARRREQAKHWGFVSLVENLKPKRRSIPKSWLPR
jgi:hypothetical protein